MDYLIIAKWMTDWSGREYGSPSVVTTVIDMALNGGSPSNPIDMPMVGTWEEQTSLETTLMLIVKLSVPAMLLVQPLVTHFILSKHDDHHAPMTHQVGH